MSTSENKLCQGTGNISSGRLCYLHCHQHQHHDHTICFTPQQITKQTLASNTYQICSSHRIVNLCSDESHPKEKKKYRHETWNIKLPMDLHIIYLLYCTVLCVCVCVCVCVCARVCVCMCVRVQLQGVWGTNFYRSINCFISQNCLETMKSTRKHSGLQY